MYRVWEDDGIPRVCRRGIYPGGRKVHTRVVHSLSGTYPGVHSLSGTYPGGVPGCTYPGGVLGCTYPVGKVAHTRVGKVAHTRVGNNTPEESDG